MKLPPIALPTFSGKYGECSAFYDTFSSLIHNDKQINKIEKLHYLKSVLNGDAAQVIASLHVSAANYDIAWDCLKNRYDNKRLIMQNHMKGFLSIPSIAKQSFGPGIEQTGELEGEANFQIVASSSTASANNQNVATLTNKQQREAKVQTQRKKSSGIIQGDLRDFVRKPTPISKSRQLDHQLVRMTIKEYHPFSIVEGKEFQKFVNMLCPNYKLPSR